ncbi:MAG: hypothetical protein MJY72_03875 [Bacteroidales bacterium]|nr:hypothetical protein [Bacteroidales bacterium]
MKRIEDIENMELDELIAEAEKIDVQVPSDLESGIRSKIVRQHRIRMDRIRYGVAAAITALFGCSLLLSITLSSRDQALEDTFDDPELAYAEVQKAFGKISDALNAGAREASLGEARFAQTTRHINDLMN